MHHLKAQAATFQLEIRKTSSSVIPDQTGRYYKNPLSYLPPPYGPKKLLPVREARQNKEWW